MSRRTFVRPLLAPNPPPPHLLASGPPLHLLPPSFVGPGPELEIAGYACSTHVFPAAWPRSTRLVPVPSELEVRDGEGKEERKKRWTNASEAILRLKEEHQAAPGDKPGDEGVLWLTATRWVRDKQQDEDKTLLCMHANGLHGSTFVPLLRHLLQQRDDIAEVWALDGVQHGDAGLLNAGKLGALFDWHDAARDALCFLTHFFPPAPPSSPLPVSLDPVPPAQQGTRRVHALGHSLGGSALAIAATRFPDLFATLILVDPAFGPPTLSRPPTLMAYVAGAIARRNAWPTRSAAHAALRANPFFGAWDEQVLDLYVKYALVERASGGVELKCAPVSEAVVFAGSGAEGEIWQALPSLDARVPLLWVDPPAEESIVKTRQLAAARVRLRPANSAHTVIPNGLHLLVQSHPRQVADAVNAFLQAAGHGTVGDARALQLPSSSLDEQQPVRAQL